MSQPDSGGFGLTYDMDCRTCVFGCFLHAHQILKSSANHANCRRTRNNRKSHDKHDTMRNTILLDQNLYMFKSICFQRVHWLSIVSRTCRRSQRATSIALWLPRRRQETTANGTFAWIPAAFSCNLETCRPLIELASLFASRMSFLSFADAFPARCRWTSPPHQGRNVEPTRRPRLNCFVWRSRGIQR